MRLPIPPPGRPQPVILRFRHLLVKKAHLPETEARRRAVAAAPCHGPEEPRARAGLADPRRGLRRPARHNAAAQGRARCRAPSQRRHRSRAAAVARRDPGDARRRRRANAAGGARARDARAADRARGVPRPHRGDAARRPADAEPQGRALRRRQARPRHRHGAGASRRLRLSRPRRRRGRPVPQPARDAQGAARRPRDGAAHRHRPARPARRRDRRRSRARQPHAGRAPVRGARRLVRRRGEPPREPGPAGAARRARRCQARRQVVMVEIVEQPSPQREAIARVVEVLGSYTDPGMEIEIALRKHDLPHEFSTAARRPGRAAAARSASGRPQGAASISPHCRWSPSTARPRRTSTTPSGASARVPDSG